jgi:hypothetical protein
MRLGSFNGSQLHFVQCFNLQTRQLSGKHVNRISGER